MRRAADACWVRLPALLGRMSIFLGFALADGDYLAVWPVAGAVAAPAGLLLGLILGAVHPGPLYTYSFIVMALLAVVAGFGAGIAVWAWLGFAITDLLASDRSALPSYGTAGFTALIREYVPLGLSYLLLAGLMVLSPVLASVMRVYTERALRHAQRFAMPSGLLVQVAAFGVLTFFWAQSTAFMIRPIWSFQNTAPDTAAIYPLQQYAVALSAIAVLAGLGRAVLTRMSRLRAPTVERPLLPGSRQPRLRLLLVPVHGLILALLLSGLTDALWQATLLWLVIVAILYTRILLVPQIPVYPPLIRRVPVVIRVGGCLLASYLFAKILVEPAANQEVESFASIIWSVALSMLVACLLIPPQRQAPAPREPTRRSPHPGANPAGHQVPNRPPPHPGPGTIAASRISLGWARAAALAGTAVLLILADAQPAAADNCGGLSDCSTGVKIAIVVVGIVAVVLLWWLIAQAATGAVVVLEEAAAEAEAAAEGGTAAAEAEEAAAEAAAEGAEEAAAEGGGEAAAEGGAEDEAASQAEAEQQRLQELAKDPDHGGKITPGSMQEARAARGLEQSGDLPGPVERAPSGGADFIDGTGQEWDVKGFRSDFPPSRGGYDFATSMEKIGNELGQGENVILDRTKLTEAAVSELKAAIDAAGWAGKVLWWPPL